MGVSGSGKSTLGALLARQLGCTFLEGDSFHSPQNVEKMRAGIPLTDTDRWPWLDQLGAAIEEAVGRDGLVVVACSALRRVYRERLTASARLPMVFILPSTTAAELARRMEGRPDHYMPPSLLGSQLATLEAPGLDEPALILDATACPEELGQQVVTWLRGAHTALRDR
ncbi:MAG: gluconokinase [Sphingomonadales bacterium]|nr:gluconokinase [Sphingomonadales bacterium]MDE2171485.1 gluconokinase [Sphingomonadales bacterium]